MNFRDPPAADVRSRELQLELAALLARAPRLPVPLPIEGLSLTGVEADRHGIDLVLSHARLRMSSSGGTVSVEPKPLESNPLPPRIDELAARLAKATDSKRWAEARALGDQLMRLPVGLPLEHLRQIVSGVRPLQGLLRTGFHCNQDCGLCWQGRDWRDFGPEQVLTWVEDFAAAGVHGLILSGGEPTIDPALFRYLERARSLGIRNLTLETNAVMMAKPGFAARLRDAGVGSVFVSLHSPDAAVSDAITRAPGTHALTVRGISALLDAGITVSLNAVMTVQSIDTLAGLPAFLHQAFEAHRLHGLMISYPALPFEHGLESAAAPPPEALRSALRATLAAAHAVRLRISGLEGPCGPPLCAHGADRRFVSLAPVPEAVDFRLYLPACEGCRVKKSCFGVRHSDYERYGDRCAEPITG
ncbi:MAG: radical SAM protein [Archangiaceae bacterium]|nr:radical SAM protein [Archangiaceae bacterium]